MTTQVDPATIRQAARNIVVVGGLAVAGASGIAYALTHEPRTAIIWGAIASLPFL